MKGIPVLPNGEPVRRTYVFAGSDRQFRNWCMYSRVNPRSRNIYYISDTWRLRGVRNIDLVYTGTYLDRPDREYLPINHMLQRLAALGEIKNTYDQFESADIEPNIVES